jgi:hypothetical protein
MAEKFQIKLTGGIALGGQVKRPGEIVEVDERFARDLLHRGKGTLVNGEPKPVVTAEPAPEPAPSDWSSLTVAELRELVPGAPSRATKAELIAMIEKQEGAEDDGA